MPTARPAKNFSLGVIILAAGASKRMGRSKLLLPWGETSVMGHLIRQWSALQARQTVVVVAPGDKPLGIELDSLAFPGRDRIPNPQPERGMFSSILCAARWDGWQVGLTHWVIALGDQPHLRIETLRSLLGFHRDHPDAICQPAYRGRARHPVLLPQKAFAELQHSRAATLRDFLEQTSCPRAECPVKDPGLAVDLDRPEDYSRAISQLTQGRQAPLD